MADSAPKVAEQEHSEEPGELERKAEAIAQEINRSKHFVAFTGTGISTSAGELHAVLKGSN